MRASSHHRTQFIGAVLLILTLVLGFWPSSALACSCGGPGSPTDEFARSTMVFEGHVISSTQITHSFSRPSKQQMQQFVTRRNQIRKLPFVAPLLERHLMSRYPLDSIDLVEMHVQVLRSWKGTRARNLSVFTQRYGDSCGAPLSPGTYLFYTDARKVKGRPGSAVNGLCSRTIPIAQAQVDLQFLAGKRTLMLYSDKMNGGLDAALLAFLVLVVLGGAITIRLKSRRS